MQNDLHDIEKYLLKFRVKKPDVGLRARVLAGGRAAWETKPSYGFWLKWAAAAVFLIVANIIYSRWETGCLQGGPAAPRTDMSIAMERAEYNDIPCFLREIKGFGTDRYFLLARLAQAERGKVAGGKWFKDRMDYLRECEM